MPPLSVLHVINAITPTGGAEVSTVQTLPLLAERGLEQVLLTLKPNTDAPAVARLRAAGVRVLEHDTPRFPGAFAAVRRAIRDHSPDLVHSVLWEADRAARPAAWVSGVPSLSSLVNAPGSDQRLPPAIARKAKVLRRVDGMMARRMTTGFHAITQAVATHACATLRVPAEAVTVVPRGRDRSPLGEPSPERRARVRTALGLAPDVPVVLNVGRQERQKGHVDLLEAFALVRREVPGAVLLIAGRPGSASPEIERVRRRLGLGDEVRLLGARSDVGDLLCAADVFAFSSLWEGLGGSVLEAMGLEVPVVAYDVPAVVEVLGGTGATAPVGDLRALAVELVRVLTNRRALDTAAARTRFEVNYSLDSAADGMMALYARHGGARGPGNGRHR